jgi:hypothetical protein
LNPILALGTILLILKSKERSIRAQFLLCGGAGLLIGLGIWTHLIFASFAAALALTAWVRMGRSFFTSGRTYSVIAGAIFGLLPRILYQLQSHQSLSESLGMSSSGGQFLHSLLERLRVWPGEALLVAHGNLIFQRFTGSVLVPALNFTALLMIAGFILIAVRAFKKGLRSTEALLLLFALVLFATTIVISPGSSERYFLLPLWIAPLWIAMAIQSWLSLATHWKHKFVRLAAVVAVAGLFAFQLLRLGVNYFYSDLSTGGRLSTFYLGGYAETSNHYVKSDYLYPLLEGMGARMVCAEFLLSSPIQFYGLSAKYPFDATWDDKSCTQAATRGDSGVYAVIYREGMRYLSPEQLPGFVPVFEDSHFMILRGGN